MRPERAEYRRGETVKLIAEPSDDFGIRRVTFFDGAAEVGTRQLAAVRSRVHASPRTRPAAAAPVAATAEDSLGQTATGTSSAARSSATRPPRAPRRRPTVELPDEPAAHPRATARSSTVRPTAAHGVAYVDFFLGARRVCRDTEAPYQCRIKAYSSDIGSQTVRVVVTDRAGLTGQDARQVVVPKFTPRGLMIEVHHKRLSGNRVQRTVIAKVLPTKGVKRSTACEDGWVAAVVQRGRVTLKDVRGSSTAAAGR